MAVTMTNFKQSGLNVRHIRFVALLKDHSKSEAKKKADDLYKEKYDNLINSLEANLQESKSKIDLEYDNLFNEFKENITTVSQDKRMLNQKLDSYLFGSENG